MIVTSLKQKREGLRNIIDEISQIILRRKSSRWTVLLSFVAVLFLFFETCVGDWLDGATFISDWFVFRIKEHNMGGGYESDNEVPLLSQRVETSANKANRRTTLADCCDRAVNCRGQDRPTPCRCVHVWVPVLLHIWLLWDVGLHTYTHTHAHAHTRTHAHISLSLYIYT